MFETPDVFDPTRDLKGSLAFGFGSGYCLGVHLARLELRVGLNAVLDRLHNVRLDPEADPPEITGFASRGPNVLPVLFDSV